MKYRFLCFIALVLLISGCGMTNGQKMQIASFATATSQAVDAAVKQLEDARSQVIEIRKEQIIMGYLQVEAGVDLESTLKAEKIAQRVAALRFLQAYANSLNALATNDQSEAISKAVTHLMTSSEAAVNAYKGDAGGLALSDGQKKAAAGIAATLAGWYIENEKKKITKEIVELYSPQVTKFAAAIEQDMSLIGYSACWPQFRAGSKEGAKPVNDKTKSGTLDIFCTEADYLREKSLILLKQCPAISKSCETVTVTVRERALNDYLKMNHDMDNMASFSTKATDLVKKMLAANNQLLKVIEDDKFTAEEIKEHAVAIKELITMVEILANKRKE
ncbi:MAG: hypothetical protein WC405_05770 [Syntrophales bacterium]